jgi:hypothetical protein
MRKNKFYVKTFATLPGRTDHLAGPNPHLNDGLEIIQRSINDFDLRDINGNPIGSASSFILDSFFPLSSGSYVHVSTIGSEAPIVTAGTSDSIITITCNAGCRIRQVALKGKSNNTDLNGDKDIRFVGLGIPGNTSINDIAIPNVQITRIVDETVFTAPTPSNPFVVVNDNTPEIQVIGIGSDNNPSLHIRLKAVDIYEAHYVTFSW